MNVCNYSSHMDSFGVDDNLHLGRPNTILAAHDPGTLGRILASKPAASFLGTFSSQPLWLCWLAKGRTPK